MLNDDDKNIDIYVEKPSGVIQVVVTDNKKLSLTQRKSWNVLIINAHGELEKNETYRIPLNMISSLLNNNDVSNLKKDILKLMSTTVQFNYLQSRDKSVWEATTLLADAKIDESSNDLLYSFGPLMREKLKNMAIYTRINLSIQKNIDSKHSLILYELAKDHYIEKNNCGQTPFIPVEDLKRLLECHDEKNYEQFKEFSRLLKRSIEEINEKSDITIEAIYKRNGKSVAWIQFQIKKKIDKSSMIEGLMRPKQKDLPFEGNKLFNKLVKEFKITPKKAMEFINEYSEEYLNQKIMYTVEQHAKGKIIESTAGFLYKAITEDYAPPETSKPVSLLPSITPGMKIDMGKGAVFAVTEEKQLRNSKNTIVATENNIRHGLAAGTYKIVEEDTVVIPEAESVVDIPATDFQASPEIIPGMKVTYEGMEFTVSHDRTIDNKHGEIIFTMDDIQKHLRSGSFTSSTKQ